jgi:RNA polymerase sigma factor (TIGR02999 family)
MTEGRGEVTQLLRKWSGGDEKALDQLMPLIYTELRKLAAYHLRRERDGHTLASTALVHEVYIRLCGQDDPRWTNRAHFFAVAARMMRRILVDYARRRRADKRGGSAIRVPLEDALVVSAQEGGPDLVALDDALKQLQAFDPRKASVVEMRFFAGMSAAETAAALGTTEATVRRDWNIAKAWLCRYLEEKAAP